MSKNIQEAFYYNAVAIAMLGNHKKISELRERWATWENVYEKIRRLGAAVPNPTMELNKLTTAGVMIILYDDEDYPPLLKETPNPPFAIYCKGYLPTRTAETPIAIVGMRGVGLRREGAPKTVLHA